MGLHQDPQASSSYAAPDGGSSNLLHRRHTPAGGDPDSGGREVKGLQYLLECLGFIVHPDKSIMTPGQVMEFLGMTVDSTNMELRWFPAKKLKGIRAEAQKLSQQKVIPVRALSRLVGKDECSQPYHTTCPTILQEPTDGHDRGPECQQSELRSRSYAVSGLPGRAKVVGLSPEPVEREEHAVEGSGLSDRIRCVTGRVGSSLQPPTDWRAMVKGGAELPGVAASNITFTKGQTGLSVLLKMDNTAVAYVNNQGGTVSRELVRLSKDLWGGVTTGDILKAADWSSESVFQKFYHKSQQNPHFGRLVLSPAGKPSE